MSVSTAIENQPPVNAYPYFRISRLYNVSYGTVLCFADAYTKSFRILNYWERKATDELQRTIIADQIISAHHIEMQRRVPWI